MPPRDHWITVLGARISSTGKLGPAARGRLNYAVTRWRGNKSATLVLSGGTPGAQENEKSITEANALKKVALLRKVPSEKILTETKSHDFIGNAVFLAKMVFEQPEAEKPKRIRVITSANYARRCRIIFKHVFHGIADVIVEAYPGSYVTQDTKLDEEDQIRVLRDNRGFIGSTERGNHKQHLNYLFTRHPYYMDSDQAKKFLRRTESS